MAAVEGINVNNRDHGSVNMEIWCFRILRWFLRLSYSRVTFFSASETRLIHYRQHVFGEVDIRCMKNIG